MSIMPQALNKLRAKLDRARNGGTPGGDDFFELPAWLNGLLRTQIVWEHRLRLNRLLPRATDLTTSIFLSETGRLTYAAFPIGSLVPTIGSSTMASPIIRSFSIATPISRNLRSTIQRSICTSRRRRSGYTTPIRINGAFTCSIWKKEL